jgi:SAM-dependent methyltransferase
MKVLDVGCGVGGPAREIAKFTGAYITGLNINEYQVQRATRYAEREGLGDKLQFVQADFMVRSWISIHLVFSTACSSTLGFTKGLESRRWESRNIANQDVVVRRKSRLKKALSMPSMPLKRRFTRPRWPESTAKFTECSSRAASSVCTSGS